MVDKALWRVPSTPLFNYLEAATFVYIFFWFPRPPLTFFFEVPASDFDFCVEVPRTCAYICFQGSNFGRICVPFHFISFHFIAVRCMKVHFISFHCHLTPFHFISSHEWRMGMAHKRWIGAVRNKWVELSRVEPVRQKMSSPSGHRCEKEMICEQIT